MLLSFGKKVAKTVAPSEVSQVSEMQTLQGIFNNLDDGLVYIDQKGTIKLINENAARLAGWTINDATNIDIKLVIKLVDSQTVGVQNENNPFVTAFLTRKQVKTKDLSIVGKNNENIPIDLTVNPILINGYAFNSLVIIKDIASENMEENRLKDFISTASHEMRTPIASTEGFLELALNPKTATLDNRGRDYILKAKDAMQRLSELFGELLNTTNADDQLIVSNPKVIEMSSALKKFTDVLNQIAEKKNIAVEYKVGSSKPNDVVDQDSLSKNISPHYFVFADPKLLGDAIDKLFDNALKFSKEGKITIGISADDSYVQVYINDSGIGIPQENLPHIFQRFYRVDNTSTRSIGGGGLGLYTCKKTIEYFKGKIWAESILGKGSTFYFTIPRLSEEEADQYSKAVVAR
jgi:PAS domain S-box-containing protein